MNATDKRGRAIVIHDHLVGNPLFPAPSPSMAEFGNAIDQLDQAILNAMDCGRIAIAAKNTAERTITEMISRLAGYVNSVCMGDAVKILSSGFQTAKRPEPISELSAPKGAMARSGQLPNQLILRWQTVPGAVMYLVEEAIGGNHQAPVWNYVDVTSDHRMELKGRDKTIATAFRVQAIGRRTRGPFTEFFYLIAA